MICKDCIHEELCAEVDDAITYCIDFKDKAQFVEVVRCKDCKYYKQNPWNKEEKVCKCWADWIPTDEIDFCSHGKKVE